MYFDDYGTIAKEMIDNHLRMFTIPEVAKILNVNKSTVSRLIYEGELMCCMVRSTYRIPEPYLIEYMGEILDVERYDFDCPLHS